MVLALLIYSVLSLYVTTLFLRVRSDMSEFPFDCVRTIGYRFALIAWPVYFFTLASNPGALRTTLHATIIWLILGFAVVRSLVAEPCSFETLAVDFVAGNLILSAVSVAVCSIVDVLAQPPWRFR